MVCVGFIKKVYNARCCKVLIENNFYKTSRVQKNVFYNVPKMQWHKARKIFFTNLVELRKKFNNARCYGIQLEINIFTKLVEFKQPFIMQDVVGYSSKSIL